MIPVAELASASSSPSVELREENSELASASSSSLVELREESSELASEAAESSVSTGVPASAESSGAEETTAEPLEKSADSALATVAVVNDSVAASDSARSFLVIS